MINTALSKWLYRYFSLNGNIVLPGLGVLSLIRVPSTNDFANKLFYPPLLRYHFEHTIDVTDESLSIYLRKQMNLSDQELEATLLEFSEEINHQLKSNGKLEWEGLGVFILNDQGQIEFLAQKENESLTGTVHYEHVIRDSYTHDVLTGDKIQTSEELQQYFEDQRKTPVWQQWQIAGLLLTLLAVVLIVVRFFFGNFSISDPRYSRFIASDAQNSYVLKK